MTRWRRHVRCCFHSRSIWPGQTYSNIYACVDSAHATSCWQVSRVESSSPRLLLEVREIRLSLTVCTFCTGKWPSEGRARARGGGVHSLKASGLLPSHHVDVDVDLASVHRSALPALSGKLLGMHNDTMMQQKYSGVGRYRSIGK